MMRLRARATSPSFSSVRRSESDVNGIVPFGKGP